MGSTCDIFSLSRIDFSNALVITDILKTGEMLDCRGFFFRKKIQGGGNQKNKRFQEIEGGGIGWN